MNGRIDDRLSQMLSSHVRRLGLKRFFQSMGYERSGELPLILSRLEPHLQKNLRYLDIGSGDSVLPSFLLKNSNWDITCLDKFGWVRKQSKLAARVMQGQNFDDRFHILQEDFLATDLPAGSFDIISNISVIEHFDGSNDVLAMERSARLLKPGGLYLLTTPVNESHFREFFVNKDVYGEGFTSAPVFFQRHYDVETLAERIVRPSGLQEIERIYFGDYGFQFFDRFMDIPWPWKPIKILYQWATPAFARRFLTYADRPISRPDMHMYTSSGVFLLLRKV
jgi:SAM-dependent methyltransferase